MINIVKRLRELGDWEVGDVKSDAIYHAAADEIELLRRQLAHSVELGNGWMDEIERLREVLVFYASFADALPHENIAPLMMDRGNKARAALTALKPKELQA